MLEHAHGARRAESWLSDDKCLPHPVKEFVVNAIAAGEARESSLARGLRHRRSVYRGA
jgi:hypothetical protein